MTKALSQRIARTGVLAAAAVLLGYVELLIPLPVPVVGAKVGLPNLAVLLALYQYGFREALAVQTVRILTAGLLFGNLFSIAFSLAGGLFSLPVMWLMARRGGFTETGVSVAGAAAHNTGQLAAAVLLVGSPGLLAYYPLLLFCAVAAGLVIGVGVREIRKRMGKDAGKA